MNIFTRAVQSLKTHFSPERQQALKDTTSIAHRVTSAVADLFYGCPAFPDSYLVDRRQLIANTLKIAADLCKDRGLPFQDFREAARYWVDYTGGPADMDLAVMLHAQTYDPDQPYQTMIVDHQDTFSKQFDKLLESAWSHPTFSARVVADVLSSFRGCYLSASAQEGSPLSDSRFVGM